MASKKSAGILLFRRTHAGIEFLLVHPGGPFFAKKDLGAWTIPKGEYESDEQPLVAAKREWQEEIGTPIKGPFLELNPIRQKSGKEVSCWAVEGDIDPTKIKSNSFEIEWLPRSGKKQSFPEIDRAEWFGMQEAIDKINPAQVAFITELLRLL